METGPPRLPLFSSARAVVSAPEAGPLQRLMLVAENQTEASILGSGR